MPTISRDLTGSIATFSGGRFWPLDPKPEDVVLEDIAHALSNKCRYTGHTSRFYSVAEHSVRIAQRLKYLSVDADPETQARQVLAGLFHDANEAYLPDVSSPVKAQLPWWADIEQAVQDCVWLKFGLEPSKDDMVWVKHEDVEIRAAEKHALFREFAGSRPLTCYTIECWKPATAKRKFLELARAYQSNLTT